MKLIYSTIDCPECVGTGTIQRVNVESLAQARKAAGLTAEQFAKKIGYTADYVYKCESGHRPVTEKIRKAYEGL